MSSVIWSPNKPNHNNTTILHPTITVPFHSYTQHICQSHPQHRWHKLLQFNKLPPTKFVCVNTNLSTALFKHSVSVTYIYLPCDSHHILQLHFLTDSISVKYSNTVRTYCEYWYRFCCISQPSIANSSQYETSALLESYLKFFAS